MSDGRRTGAVQLLAATAATERLLAALGYDTTDPDLRDTPGRVARAWKELLDADTGATDRAFDTTATDEMVVLRGITGWSVCEHHLLPFSYVAAVGYVPSLNGGAKSRILGLSKLARIVRRHAAALQVQERMTQLVADDLVSATGARGVAVRISGVHLCAVMRGVHAEQAEFVTTALRGVMLEPAPRAEFLDAAGR